MENEKIKLKACPFCGKEVAEICSAYQLEACLNFESDTCPCEQYGDPGRCGYFTIVCNYNKGGCGSSGAWKASIEEAAEAWNRRPYENS